MEGAQAQLKLLSTGRRRALLVLPALLAIAGVVYMSWPAERIGRSGSTELPQGRFVLAERATRGYEIEYTFRSIPSPGDDITSGTKSILVRRPFDAKTSDGVTTFARASFGEEILAVPPDIPEGDARPDAVLHEAVRDGYADERELRRVARRVCRTYRVTGTDQLDLLPSSPNTFTDICVDEDGLILEKVEFSGDEISYREMAIRVDESPNIDQNAFDLEEPSIDASVSGNAVQELEPDSRLPGGKFWDLTEPLEGFDHHGRFAVVESDPQDRTDRRTSVTDVWTSGPDVVFIERLNPGRDGTALTDEAGGQRVDAGEIGLGELIYGLRTSEVRVATERGRVVRVRGTLAPSRLLEIARTLDPLAEGPLAGLGTD